MLQVVVIGGALWFLAWFVYRYRAQLASTRLEISPPAIVAGSALTIATYAFMVWTWTWTMRWWGGGTLRFPQAWRIWALSNLSRFIPGYVWQFAGLAGMASRAGASPVAATGGVLLQQAISLLAGVLLCAAFFPTIASATLPLSHDAALALAVAGLVAAVLILPRSTALLQRLGDRFFRGRVVFPALRATELAAYTAVQLLPWLAYGVAFWLFAKGIVGERAPSLALSIASFTAAYAWGIVWVVAPGGLGVREAALVTLLTPHVGGEIAIVLALGSRAWLTLVEIVGALVAIGYAATASQPTPTSR